jgi:surface polysaccharide O-acyltransferase-like enzyme
MYDRLPYFHFWFVYEITGIYLLLPVLRLIVRSGGLALRSFLVIWIVFGIIAPTLQASALGLPSTKLSVGIFSGYIGYPVIGYLLAQSKALRTGGRWGALVYISVSLCIALVAYSAMKNSGRPTEIPYFHYQTPWVLLAAIGAFAMFLNIPSTGLRTAQAVRSLADGTFGVYFLHMIVVEALTWGLITGFPLAYTTGGSAWTGTASLTMLTFGICFLALYPIRRIRALRYVVG